MEIVSREYKEIKKEKKSVIYTYFERACKLSYKIFPTKVTKREEKEMKKYIDILDLNVTPNEVSSFAFFSLIILLLLTVFFLLLGNLLLLLLTALLSFGAYFYIKNFPKNEVNKRLLRNSSQLVSLIMYLAVYMRQNPNLELAVKFAADNLEGDIAKDMKKLLWKLQSKVYVSIIDALDDYVNLWKDLSPEFADAIYLIKASLYQRSEEDRLKLIDEAVDRMLEGNYIRLVNYASSLRNPINTIYMLGIVLPVLAMVMFPMVMSFMQSLLNPTFLFIGYNLLLPAFVYWFLSNTMQKRPTAFRSISLEKYPGLPKFGYIKFLGSDVPVIAISIIVFLSISSIFFWYLSKRPNQVSENDVYFSLPFTLALGLAIYVYSKLVSKDRLEIAKKIYSIEKSFSDAIFQLGGQLAQNVPVEKAFIKVANVMKNTPIEEFFNIVVKNMQELGMSVEEALFNKNYGACKFFPSPIIKSVMRILIDSAKKSLSHAGVSMIFISKYLRNLERVNARVKEVLDEVLSSMRFQVAFLSPIISAIVVSMTALVLIVLAVLGSKLQSIQATDVQSAIATPFTLSLLNIQASGIPLYAFQIAIGIYTIQIVFLITYSISNIERAGDKVYFYASLSSSIIISTLIYSLLAALLTLVLTSLGKLSIGVSQIFGG